jgi:hypothetical protein
MALKPWNTFNSGSVIVSTGYGIMNRTCLPVDNLGAHSVEHSVEHRPAGPLRCYGGRRAARRGLDWALRALRAVGPGLGSVQPSGRPWGLVLRAAGRQDGRMSLPDER